MTRVRSHSRLSTNLPCELTLLHDAPSSEQTATQKASSQPSKRGLFRPTKVGRTSASCSEGSSPIAKSRRKPRLKRQRLKEKVVAPSLPPQPPLSSPDALLARACKGVLPPASYWRRIAPGLHVADPAFLASFEPLTLPSPRVEQLRSQLVSEGFFTLSPEEMAWQASLPRMRRGVRRLVALGWPASLIMMYDEVWGMARQMGGLMEAVCGCVNTLDTLAWMVEPSLGQSGFAPHRDRQPADVPASFSPDGRRGLHSAQPERGGWRVWFGCSGLDRPVTGGW